MTVQTDVLASKAKTSDGQLVDENDGNLGRVRVKAIYIVPTPSTAGSVAFKDGGSGGTTKFTINIPSNATGGQNLLLPGQGVLFKTNVYVDITDVASVMVFYG
jgi:hypothetical protein